MTERVAIRGLGMMSGLGEGGEAHVRAVCRDASPFRPLGALLGEDSPWAFVPASWIEPRALLGKRKYGPASNLSLCLARAAAADAGWGEAELRDAALFVGSSRGNAAGWLDPWPGRRPVKLLAASNSLHSELAAAVTIELGIRGPYHVLANGCSAGLDALGMAFLFLRSGMVRRALVVGLDLPLSPSLLATYGRTGMLSSNGVNDPYGPEASGLLPGEGGAAFALELTGGGEGPFVTGYWANSDADSLLGMPEDGHPLAELYERALKETVIEAGEAPPVICPHASGTRNNAIAETNALRRAWGGVGLTPRFCMMKPYVGHTIGASGALETAILCAFAREDRLPAHSSRFSRPDLPFIFPGEGERLGRTTLFKSASSMGGHNSLISLSF